MYVCIHVCMCTYVYVCVYICVCMYVCVCVCVYVCVYVYIYMYVCMYIHTYVCICVHLSLSLSLSLSRAAHQQMKNCQRPDPFSVSIYISHKFRSLHQTELQGRKHYPTRASSARDRNPLRMVFSSIEPLLERTMSLPSHQVVRKGAHGVCTSAKRDLV